MSHLSIKLMSLLLMVPLCAAQVNKGQYAQASGKLSIGYLNSNMSLIEGAETDVESVYLSGLLSDPLVAADETSALKCILVEDKYDDLGGSKYQFKIKTGVKWVNGKPITGKDIEASFFVWRNQQVQRRSYNKMSTYISSVKASDSDPTSFTVSFYHPVDNPLRYLSLPVFNSSVIESGKFTEDFMQRIRPCNGPFVIDGMWNRSSSEINLKRNTNYVVPWPDEEEEIKNYKTYLTINGVTLVQFSSSNELYDALASQDVRFYFYYPYSINVDNRVLTARDLVVGNITGVVINVDAKGGGHELLSQNGAIPKVDETHKDLRKALDLLIDRTDILKQKLRMNLSEEMIDMEYTLYGPMRKSDYLASKLPPKPSPNISQAEALFIKSGLKKQGGKWFYNGKPFELSFLRKPRLDESMRLISDYVIKQLTDFGITVNQPIVQNEDYYKKLRAGDFNLAFYSAMLPFEDYWVSAQQFFKSGNLYNYSKYRNARVDQLFDQADNSKNVSDAKNKSQDACKAIEDDHPWIFLFNMPYRVVYTKNFVHNMSDKLNGDDLFQDIHTWQTGYKGK